MKTFYSALSRSCKKFYSSFKHVLLIVLVDIAFLISFGLVYTKVWSRMMVHIEAVVSMMDSDIAGLAGAQSADQLAALASNSAEFIAHYRQINYCIGVLAVSVLVLWCVFQGMNWFMTSALVEKKKHDFWRYMARFAAATIVWWVLFLVISAFGLKMSMYSSAAALPWATKVMSSALVYILMFLLFSFAYTSYAIAQHHSIKSLLKQTAMTLWKHYKILAPVYAFTIFVILGEYLIFMKSMALGGYASAAFALLILFPSIAWTRFYAITALEK